MDTKQRLYPSISLGVKAFGFVLLMLVTACGGQEDPNVEKEDKVQLSDQEITFVVDGWKAMTESRATIFETQDDFLNLNEGIGKGGGDFTLYAFTRGSDTPFIDGSRVNYQTSSNRWRFFAYPNYIEYYWPQAGIYDFFAHMPYKGSGKQNVIKSIEYNKNNGSVTLACEMPSTITDVDDPDGQETIFAYKPGLNKESGTVNMHFVHPFAAIYFELKQAHRALTINWIQFDNVYCKGTTTLDATTQSNAIVTWSPTGESAAFNITIDKTIPDDINFMGEIGGPYLVMPQIFAKGTGNTNDDVTITVNYTWDDGQDQDKTNDTHSFTVPISTGTITGWMAGNKYTYILDLGDNKEEILFKVQVEPWASGGVKNEIDVQ